jgi:hypothetical protein
LASTNTSKSKKIQESQYSKTGVPNLGDARGSQVVVFWVQLYQWGDVIDVRGDGEAKRLRTPALKHLK